MRTDNLWSLMEEEKLFYLILSFGGNNITREKWNQIGSTLNRSWRGCRCKWSNDKEKITNKILYKLVRNVVNLNVENSETVVNLENSFV